MSVDALLNRDPNVHDMGEIPQTPDFSFNAEEMITNEDWESLSVGVSYLMYGKNDVLAQLKVALPHRFEQFKEGINRAESKKLRFPPFINKDVISKILKKQFDMEVLQAYRQRKRNENGHVDWHYMINFLSILRQVDPAQADALMANGLSTQDVEEIVSRPKRFYDINENPSSILHEGFKVKMAFPDRKSGVDELDPSQREKVWKKPELAIDPSGVRLKVSLGYIILAKTLFPEKEIKLPNYTTSLVTSALDGYRTTKSWESFLELAYAATIVSADQVRITRSGLELISNNLTKEVSPQSSLPPIERFQG
jgi:hypothetical protein